MLELSIANVILGLGLILSIIGGSIKIGTLSNQIIINTGRLTKLEEVADAFQIHAANTSARWPDLERRIGRAETIINHVTIKKEFE